MKDTNELILGIDLCNKCSQVSYYDEKTKLAESVPLKGSQLVFENPVPLEQIFSSVQEGLPVLIDELKSLIGILLDSAKKYRNISEVCKVCVTVEEFSIVLLEPLKKVFYDYGYSSDRISFISHEESYAYYAFSVKRELWNGGVILFDYNQTGLQTHLLSSIKEKDKDIIIEERSSFLDADLLGVIEGNKKLDDIDDVLLNVSKKLLNGRFISSVYLTGLGFDTEKFPEGFLKFICNRHRVFAGQNLYVKGACIAAYEEKYHTRFANTLFACKNRISVGIEIGILERGKPRMFRVVKSGTNWFEANRTMDFILDDCNEIKLYIIPIVGKSYEEVIDLSDFPYRTGKATRVRVQFQFMADARCQVTIKDKGFGEIAKSSGKVIYKDLKL